MAILRPTLAAVLVALASISCSGSSNDPDGALTAVDNKSGEIDTGSQAATSEFPFALWGPWNTGEPAPPQPDGIPALEGWVDYDGNCAYLVVDREDLQERVGTTQMQWWFGSEPKPRVLLVFPDGRRSVETRWHPDVEAVAHGSKFLRSGDYLKKSSWYFSRDVDLDRRLPLRWGQARKHVIQEWDESCDTRFVLGL